MKLTIFITSVWLFFCFVASLVSQEKCKLQDPPCSDSITKTVIAKDIIDPPLLEYADALSEARQILLDEAGEFATGRNAGPVEICLNETPPHHGAGVCIKPNKTLHQTSGTKCELLDGKYVAIATATVNGEQFGGKIKAYPPQSCTFHFFNFDRPDLLLVFDDACVVNNHRWVFIAAASDVEWQVSIEGFDSEEDGRKVKTYSGTQGDPRSKNDTTAFKC